MSKGSLYIDCTSGVSGDMLCQCLTDLCVDKSLVEEAQQLISDELHHEQERDNERLHEHSHVERQAAQQREHSHVERQAAQQHEHTHDYSHRSFQSILTLLSECRLDQYVKAMTLKIYTILAIAEAEVHGETLETVHFHEVGRPQAIINMVGIAAALAAIQPKQIFCSKIIDGTGTVQCAHGEIKVPVPAVRALMNKSNLVYGTADVRMEQVTPTGLAALLAMEPLYMASRPESELVLNTAQARGDRRNPDSGLTRGLKITLFRG